MSGGSESTKIIGPSKSDLVQALHSLEYVLGLARFRVFMSKLYYYIWHIMAQVKASLSVNTSDFSRLKSNSWMCISMFVGIVLIFLI